jgi:hypothetical protein
MGICRDQIAQPYSSIRGTILAKALVMRIREIWRRTVSRLNMRGRYSRELENEITRLREENRALVNSILGLAGIPPMRPLSKVANTGGPEGRPYSDAMVSAETNSEVVPLRRRSWQQLGRVREIEDARAAHRERESDADVFPAPRNIVPRL